MVKLIESNDLVSYMSSMVESKNSELLELKQEVKISKALQDDLYKSYIEKSENFCGECEKYSENVEEHGSLVNERKILMESHTALIEEHSVLVKERGEAVKEYGDAVKRHECLVKERGEAVERHVCLANEIGVICKEYGKMDTELSVISDKMSTTLKDFEELNRKIDENKDAGKFEVKEKSTMDKIIDFFCWLKRVIFG